MWAVITSEDVLLAYGPLGVSVLALGWLARFFFMRLVHERDELHAQREQMITMLVELVPLIKRATEVIETVERGRGVDNERTQQLMVDVRDVMKDVRRNLETRP